LQFPVTHHSPEGVHPLRDFVRRRVRRLVKVELRAGVTIECLLDARGLLFGALDSPA
jgi:hypothetical protein